MLGFQPQQIAVIVIFQNSLSDRCAIRMIGSTGTHVAFPDIFCVILQFIIPVVFLPDPLILLVIAIFVPVYRITGILNIADQIACVIKASLNRDYGIIFRVCGFYESFLSIVIIGIFSGMDKQVTFVGF